MGDSAGTTYTNNDISALLNDTTEMVVSHSRAVPENYPGDYLYYPLKGNDGNPLITKVGGEYFSAWMKRDEIGGNFNTIALLTKNQVNQIYKSSPDAMPSDDKYQSPTKVFDVNPTVTGKAAKADNLSTKFKTYKTDSTDSSYNIVSEKFLSEAVGGAYNFLGSAQDGNYQPPMVISDKNIVYSVSGINFKTDLEGMQNKVVLGQQSQSIAPVEAKPEMIVAKKNYTNTYQSGARAPEGVTDKLDKIMANLGVNVNSGERVSQINRSVVPALKYLRDVAKYDETFKVEAASVVAELREMGLSNHANIISEYAQDPSRSAYRSAKTDIKKVSVVESIASNNQTTSIEAITKTEPITIEEAKASVQARVESITPDMIRGHMDNTIDKLGLTLSDAEKDQVVAKVQAELGESLSGKLYQKIIQDTLDDLSSKMPEIIEQRTLEITQKPMNHGAERVASKFAQVAAGDTALAQKLLDGYKDAAPESATAVCEKMVEKGYTGLSCSQP